MLIQFFSDISSGIIPLIIYIILGFMMIILIIAYYLLYRGNVGTSLKTIRSNPEFQEKLPAANAMKNISMRLV